jgi:hypothetical protein
MVEGARPRLTLSEATQAGDRRNKVLRLGKRPVSTISALIAATISPASRPAALAGMSAACAMTSVRNFFDMHGPPSARVLDRGRG